MRRVSSRLTWWNKTAAPLVLIVWFLIFINPLDAVIQRQISVGAFTGIMIVAFSGYLLMRWLVFTLVDAVWIDGAELVVIEGGQEERVPIANIVKVEASQCFFPESVTITLKEPCRFGLTITFSAPVRCWGSCRPPIAKELIRLAHVHDKEGHKTLV